MTTEHRISAVNLGPIPEIEFSLQSPGVTVLVAPNGSGKTILLDAVQAAARGEGKLPLRDRTKKGKVEAFGATITIGGTCRHTGSFEVTNIEGRFDLAQLVDPRLKSPAAADKARIKALVSLTNVEASASLFRNHEAFEDFDTVVNAEALATDDLVEMATKIKACYDDEALKCERRAEREYGQATALIAPSDLDLDEESDADVLQRAYNEARDAVTRLEEQAKNAASARMQLNNAKKILEELGDEDLRKERTELENWLGGVDEEINTREEQILELLRKVESLRAEVKGMKEKGRDSVKRLEAIDNQLKRIDDARKVVSKESTLIEPEQVDIDEARAEMKRAADAIQLGVRIRAAKENLGRITSHRTKGKEEQDRALRYRDAGKTTDEVLSSCIRCPQLRVESDGKTARLVSDHPLRGNSIPYHDLSEGERWTIAIDIGADQVGEGGLLVISQIGWEGIDGKNRLAIHEHAVKRGVYILTAEAASDPNASREIIPTPLGGNPVDVPKAVKPPEKATPPKEKPKPKSEKRVPNVAPPVDDMDDIPF